jgi:hypothetical protein
MLSADSIVIKGRDPLVSDRARKRLERCLQDRRTGTDLRWRYRLAGCAWRGSGLGQVMQRTDVMRKAQARHHAPMASVTLHDDR